MVYKILTTRCPEETRSLGEEIGKTLKTGEILCLYGELGSGKTTFIQGLARGLGIQRRIISPTFIFIREYPTEGGIFFYHIDCYRIENEKQTKDLGLKDLIENSQNILAIEWAEKIKKLLPKKRIDIYFENRGERKRKIIINHLTI